MLVFDPCQDQGCQLSARKKLGYLASWVLGGMFRLCSGGEAGVVGHMNPRVRLGKRMWAKSRSLDLCWSLLVDLAVVLIEPTLVSSVGRTLENSVSSCVPASVVRRTHWNGMSAREMPFRRLLRVLHSRVTVHRTQSLLG